MLISTASQRILRASSALLSWQGLDADGNEADPGTVTVEVVRSDGDTVKAAGTATIGTGTDPRTVALSASETASLDLLTARWSVSGVEVAETHHEVVGGYYVSVGEVRSAERSLADGSQYPTPLLNACRSEVEHLFESVCAVAFVPRFAVERLDGNGQGFLLLSWPQLREVRWCRVWTSDTTYTELTSGELAAIRADRAGIAVRSDNKTWPCGVRNIEIGYTHGYDTPPADLKKAAIRAIRHQANRLKSAVDERATTFTMLEGGTVSLATPGMGIWHTGIPEVDETLRRYSHRTPSIA